MIFVTLGEDIFNSSQKALTIKEKMTNWIILRPVPQKKT